MKILQRANFIFLLIFSSAIFQVLFAQQYYGSEDRWIKQAEQDKPLLTESIVHPVGVIDIVQQEDGFQGLGTVSITDIDTVYDHSFKQIQSIIVDFGDHYTGYFSMNLETIAGTSDAPTRFKLTFGEVPSELVTPFDPYRGELSRAWGQDEVITIMHVPAMFELERRMAFRYLKIELLGASRFFDFRISNLECRAVTSAVQKPSPLDATVPKMIRRIDEVSQKTLAECMQTVYEDGPKRDRRLWAGDMYLQSLANNYSFMNDQLTRRCLYLFAGVSDEEGYILGTLFETPEPHAQAGQRPMDYSLLYNVTVLEYVRATDDLETANDLWPVVKRQLSIYDKYVDEEGLFMYEEAQNEWWLFFDWKEGLNKEASMQGLMIFALNRTYELALMLGKEDEVSDLPALAKKMSKAAMKKHYNKKTGLFESGPDRQISFASQIWMAIAGVPTMKQSQHALQAVVAAPNALHPGGPYMYHFYIQALIDSDMPETARSSLLHYWGGMIKKGADTFWEVYDPENDFLTPYNFYPINSYCHAWSCTPIYFIRKYPEIFQRQ